MPGDRGEEKTSSLVSFYSTVFLVILLDQLSKLLALKRLRLHDSVPVFEGFFHWTLIQNTGIAFGFFSGYHSFLFTLISASLLALFFWASRLRHSDPLTKVGFALILGGAVGNWVDRVRVGAVIDFIDFRIWPVFNLADSFITAGVALYFIAFLRKKK